MRRGPSALPALRTELDSGGKKQVIAVSSHGGSTVPQQSPGLRAGPTRRGQGWLWWVSRWSLPLYRVRLGWLLGHRFMLITHVGRNSGKTRRTCVMVLRFDASSGEAFVAAGSPRADWYLNIHASPAAEVAAGARRYRPVQRFLTAEQIAQVLAWSRDHQRFRARVQSRFFHWPWPQSDEDLQRLSRSLGGVAFRPALTCRAGGESRPQKESRVSHAA
jgi:deazaflavin-dependent oxidoreductase (nitroreductase family)